MRSGEPREKSASRRAKAEETRLRQAETDDRRIELELLRRQAKATERNFYAAAVITGALLFLAFSQWGLELAKARPRFSVSQIPHPGYFSLLPASLEIVPTGGVSEVTESTASQHALLHYGRPADRTYGNCAVRFVNFHGWTQNSLNFALSPAALRFLALTEADDARSVGFQPVQTIIRVTYSDLFERWRHKYLLLTAGRASTITPEEALAGQLAGMELNLQLSPDDGQLIVFRTNPGETAPDCLGALRAISHVAGVAVADRFIMARDRSHIIFRNQVYFFEGAIGSSGLPPAAAFGSGPDGAEARSQDQAPTDNRTDEPPSGNGASAPPG